MSRSVRLRLTDIVEAIDGIRTTVANVSFDQFCENRTVRRAVERELEIISEASRHIPADLQEAAPDVPWREIAGIGNVLRHEYQRAADNIVWNVVELHVDPLRDSVMRLLARLPDDDGAA